MAVTTCVALLLLAMAAQGIHAVDFVVNNSVEGSDGGKRFDSEIGRADAQQIMDAASQFIWQTFAQQSITDRKNVQTVTLFVELFEGSLSEYPAYTKNDQIHLSAKYVANYQGDVKNEITGILYHEMTHVWQWNNNNAAPSWLIEGIADYVRLTADLARSDWVKPGGGNSWEDSYAVTAYFLQYCDSVTSGFVAKMNSKLRDGWDLGFFNDLTGKSVDELWNDYKAKYANSS
jgi:hypothetical protein